MALIKPFKAVRYNCEKAGDISTLTCPPYDIISDNEYKELTGKNKYNMVNLELPHGDDMYENAYQFYSNCMKDGILKQDNNDCFYIYEEEFTVNSDVFKIKGFICLVKLEDFSKKVVLPHEETLTKAKTDRFNLMSTTYSNFSQIYSLYIDENGKSSSLINKMSDKSPDVEFKTNDDIIHRLWIVDDENTNAQLASHFNDRQLYIADGHHRYETALKFKQKLLDEGKITDENHAGNFVMMMLVDMENDGLVVFPTHRLIKDSDKFSEEIILQGAQKNFNIIKINNTDNIAAELDKLKDTKSVAFYTGKDYFHILTLKNNDAVKKALPRLSDASCGLDVSVLHTLLLDELLGINKESMANQSNLVYTKILQQAIDSVKSGEYQCSFILNPTKVSEIKDVALANEKMPQKSTYFYPKIITGLVINKICERN